MWGLTWWRGVDKAHIHCSFPISTSDLTGNRLHYLDDFVLQWVVQLETL